ncbi:MAG: hypothetical protein NW220_22305 [Leptolyngbyaceae cyanobacterium bins.349]|nr:hypothetical protein [Leptolyngbyaceae cyanobacterium bins.349]
MPKDNSGEVLAIDRNGQVTSTFTAEKFENLIERFAIAYQQIQMTERQQDNDLTWELE